MKVLQKIAIASFAALLLACNQSTPGQNTTDAGTQRSDNTANSEMEDNRQPADVDTVVSPGSNADELKDRSHSSDPNMAGQSDTHGRDTKAGK